MINMPAPTHASSASTPTTSSVHSQFAALSRDRDQFQKQLESVQKQYASGQTQLQQLTAQQEELVGKIRVEQERLGTLTRQQDLLQSEQARLNRVLQNERQALQQCADHLRDTHSKHQETLQTYCRESDPIHLQSVSLLQQQLAQQELLPLVSAASLQYALQQAKQSQSSTTTTTTSSSTTTSPTTVAASTSTLSNNNMTSKAILQMMETIPLEELAAAETKYQDCKNSLQKLQAQVQQLRQRAVASGQLTTDDSSSDTALRRLEAQFFQDDSSTSKEQVPRRPPAMDDNSAYLSADAKANMDLFYGTQEDADEEQQRQLEG